MFSATTSAKYGATSSVGSSGSASYASRIRFRNRARMMQPPRQMVAIAPRSICQPYSSLPAWMWSKPCAYATTFEA